MLLFLFSFSFVPTWCISNPTVSNVLLMLFSPMVRSSLETKMKKPPSTYSISLQISENALWAVLLIEWPLSLASGKWHWFEQLQRCKCNNV